MRTIKLYLSGWTFSLCTYLVGSFEMAVDKEFETFWNVTGRTLISTTEPEKLET